MSLQIMPKFKIRDLITLTAFLAIGLAFILTQRSLTQSTAELHRLKQEYRVDEPAGIVDVVIDTGSATVWPKLSLSATNGEPFRYSFSSSGRESDELGVSVDATYVGGLSFDTDAISRDRNSAGHVIAVKISFYDSDFNDPKESKTYFAVYKGIETTVSGNHGVVVTIRPPDPTD